MSKLPGCKLFDVPIDILACHAQTGGNVRNSCLAPARKIKQNSVVRSAEPDPRKRIYIVSINYYLFVGYFITPCVFLFMVIARFAKIWYSKKDISDFTADAQRKRKSLRLVPHPSIIITRKHPDVNFNILSSLLVMFNSVRSWS